MCFVLTFSPLHLSVRPGRRRLRGGLAIALLGVVPPLAGAQSSLTLHQAIQAAQTSPLARIAQGQVEAAQGQVRQAGLRPNPRLYLQTEDIRPWANDFSYTNNTEDYGYVGQTLEVDGKRSKRLSLASANLRRTQADRDFQGQVIAGRVAEAYWYALSSLHVSDLLQKDLDAVDKTLQYQQERVDAGAMRGVDLIRMQIERDRLFLALDASRRDAALATVDLFRQMGQRPRPNVALTEPMEASDPVSEVPLSSVLAQRADVAAARAALTAAEADLKLQKAFAVPDPDLLGGYKRNSTTNTIYAALQIPLPFMNRNQGEIERAQASIRIARAQVEQTENLVRADVAAAAETYARAQAIVEHTLPGMRERARKDLEIMSDAYRTGGVDLLRYIDAERTEFDVEVQALRVLSEYHQSALRLQLAYGVQP